MTQERKSTLEWMGELVEQAYEEGHNYDMRLINKLGSYPSFSNYINNVKTGRISPERFAAQFPALIQEAEEMRRQIEAAEQMPDVQNRLTTIEESLAKLPDLIAQAVTKLVEDGTLVPATPAATTAAPVAPAAPASPKGKGKPAADAAPAPVTPAEPAGDDTPTDPPAPEA